MSKLFDRLESTMLGVSGVNYWTACIVVAIAVLAVLITLFLK